MPIQINVHAEEVTACSRDFGDCDRPFCTMEIKTEDNLVIVFVHNVEDARRLVDAAIETLRHAEAIEIERRIDEALKQKKESEIITPDMYNTLNTYDPPGTIVKGEYDYPPHYYNEEPDDFEDQDRYTAYSDF